MSENYFGLRHWRAQQHNTVFEFATTKPHPDHCGERVVVTPMNPGMSWPLENMTIENAKYFCEAHGWKVKEIHQSCPHCGESRKPGQEVCLCMQERGGKWVTK